MVTEAMIVTHECPCFSVSNELSTELNSSDLEAQNSPCHMADVQTAQQNYNFVWKKLSNWQGMPYKWQNSQMVPQKNPNSSAKSPDRQEDEV